MKSIYNQVFTLFILTLFSVISLPLLAANDSIICHKPGTPAENTLSVNQNALPGHLGHGDTLGACVSDDDDNSVDNNGGNTNAANNNSGGNNVIICHLPGTPAENTISVNQSALSGHLGHGDISGACDGDENIQSPDPFITALLINEPNQTIEIPEPASWSIFGSGLLFWLYRRKTNKTLASR
ncbi:PEP-CTERM sorting domain-containing protein [Photobacterium nomapromontoriensis]|uniref:PEP-CTERM sorting domain-containing protein n=1 Tax=Photobacterium nomapromontoriensis TaxID=2910237 RepID=UPI003D0DDBFF